MNQIEDGTRSHVCPKCGATCTVRVNRVAYQRLFCVDYCTRSNPTHFESIEYEIKIEERDRYEELSHEIERARQA